MVKTKKMEVTSCRRCRKFFKPYSESVYCPVCQEYVNKTFRRVKTYIRENKHAGIDEISEACAISAKQIIQWVREERLFFTEGSDVRIPCTQCGNPISIGKYCDPCKRKNDKSIKDLRSALVTNENLIAMPRQSSKRLRFGN